MTAIDCSLRTPITPPRAPVMPTSVMYAVPPGSTRASAVGTWVCVPTTAVTRPSRYQPSATFSRGRLGMHVDQDLVGAGHLAQRLLDGDQRRAAGLHVQVARQVHDPERDAVALHHAGPAARLGAQVVGGPDDAGLGIEVGPHLAVAVGVVAQRDRVDAEREQLVGLLRRDADAAGRVLAVDHHEVGGQLLAQAGQQRAQRPPPGSPHHVADEQDARDRPDARAYSR